MTREQIIEIFKDMSYTDNRIGNIIKEEDWEAIAILILCLQPLISVDEVKSKDGNIYRIEYDRSYTRILCNDVVMFDSTEWQQNKCHTCGSIMSNDCSRCQKLHES